MDLNARLAELRRRYIGTMPEKRDALDGIIERVRAGEAGSADDLRGLAHKLVGSGSSYGTPGISRAAEVVEAAGDADLIDAAAKLRAELERAHAEG